jgi:hypothetical protein
MVLLTGAVSKGKPAALKLQALHGWAVLVQALLKHAPAQLANVMHQVPVSAAAAQCQCPHESAPHANTWQLVVREAGSVDTVTACNTAVGDCFLCVQIVVTLLGPLHDGGSVATAAVRVVDAIVIHSGERFQVGTFPMCPSGQPVTCNAFVAIFPAVNVADQAHMEVSGGVQGQLKRLPPLPTSLPTLNAANAVLAKARGSLLAEDTVALLRDALSSNSRSVREAALKVRLGAMKPSVTQPLELMLLSAGKLLLLEQLARTLPHI